MPFSCIGCLESAEELLEVCGIDIGMNFGLADSGKQDHLYPTVTDLLIS